ncbi:dihydrodipicolinate synthase family protein [Arenibacter echinorum]|nr:dihydrodipicolinate synthase family protein [Arenibacter echinorum]
MLAAKKLFPLKGIVTVLNTPFTKVDTIDHAALKNNVEEALKAGVAGILVPAMAAEVYKLSHSERLEMLSTVLETVGDKIPVIGGAGEHDLSKSRELLKAYINLGGKNVLFQIPFIEEQQFRKHFMELAALDPEMIMLQDWDATGYGLSDDLIIDLFEKVAAFRCLKIETVPAGPKYSRILELTQGKLNVSGGWAVTQMMEGLQRGVHAFMPTGMHFIYTSIYRMFTEGRTEDAEALFGKIIPVLAFSNQHLDISIHFFKRLLFRQGIYSTPNVRNPILPFDAVHKKLADKHIDTIIMLENQLKAQRANIH